MDANLVGGAEQVARAWLADYPEVVHGHGRLGVAHEGFVARTARPSTATAMAW